MRIAFALWCCACLAAAELLPGWPQALPGVDLPSPAWKREDGQLLALDETGRVRWRRPLAPGALLWSGTGGALLADDRGLRRIGPDGDELALPPLPGDVTPLGIDRGVASFAQERSGWLLPATAGDAPLRIDLGGEALGPALADGGDSLWLTMFHLVHHRDGATTRHRHGLAAGRGWRLARDVAGHPLVLAPDGRTWLLPPHRTGADDERLGRDVALAADAPRDARLRAALRRGDWTEARNLAAGTAEHAAVAMYARAAVPAGAEDLSPMPRDPGEALLPQSAWSGGQAPRARAEHVPPAAPDGVDRDQPLTDASEVWPDEALPLRTAEGLVLGLRSWSVDDDGERATATCRDDGRPRWFSRWLPEPGLGAPARFLEIRQGRLLVGEGDARLLLFDLGDGTPMLDARLRRLPVLPGRTWPHGDGAVVLHPPGRDDRLGWIGADGSEHDDVLPRPAHWILALPGGEVWVALKDGRTLAARAPGNWRAITLPAALVAAQQPRPVDGGIAADGQRWTWRVAAPRVQAYNGP